MPRHVPLCEKAFFFEQSKRKVQVEAKGHEGIFLGIKDESERAAELFLRSVQKMILEIVCRSTASVGTTTWRAECGWMLKLQSQRTNPPLTVGEQVPRTVYIRRQMELARYGHADMYVYRVPACVWDKSRRITARTAVPGLSST